MLVLLLLVLLLLLLLLLTLLLLLQAHATAASARSVSSVSGFASGLKEDLLRDSLGEERYSQRQRRRGSLGDIEFSAQATAAAGDLDLSAIDNCGAGSRRRPTLGASEPRVRRLSVPEAAERGELATDRLTGRQHWAKAGSTVRLVSSLSAGGRAGAAERQASSSRTSSFASGLKEDLLRESLRESLGEERYSQRQRRRASVHNITSTEAGGHGGGLGGADLIRLYNAPGAVHPASAALRHDGIIQDGESSAAGTGASSIGISAVPKTRRASVPEQQMHAAPRKTQAEPVATQTEVSVDGLRFQVAKGGAEHHLHLPHLHVHDMMLALKASHGSSTADAATSPRPVPPTARKLTQTSDPRDRQAACSTQTEVLMAETVVLTKAQHHGLLRDAKHYQKHHECVASEHRETQERLRRLQTEHSALSASRGKARRSHSAQAHTETAQEMQQLLVAAHAKRALGRSLAQQRRGRGRYLVGGEAPLHSARREKREQLVENAARDEKLAQLTGVDAGAQTTLAMGDIGLRSELAASSTTRPQLPGHKRKNLKLSASLNQRKLKASAEANKVRRRRKASGLAASAPEPRANGSAILIGSF